MPLEKAILPPPTPTADREADGAERLHGLKSSDSLLEWL